VALINCVWGIFNAAVSTANLPGDTIDAWEAIMSVPELLPFGIATLSLTILGWSFLPPKQPEPVADTPPPPPAAPSAEGHFGERVVRAIVDGMNARAGSGTDIWDRIDDKEQEARVYQAELARKRAAITAKAQLMTDRLASRNHSMMEPGRSPTHDSYLAAMWDAEERGEILDETHRSTFPPPPPNRWELLARTAKLMGVFEVPLRDVVRRVAFESKWAIQYDRTDALALTGTPSAPKWQVDLKAELLRQFCTIRSRGIYQEAGEKPHNGESAITPRLLAEGGLRRC
jgi:hypothetical protein